MNWYPRLPSLERSNPILNANIFCSNCRCRFHQKVWKALLACSHTMRGGRGAECDSSAPPFRQWNVKCVFTWNVTKAQSSHCRREACRRKIRCSTFPRPFQSCCIYCESYAYHGFGSAITAYSYTDKATDGKKVWYILRLAVKCKQNDTYVKDQAIDAVQA